MSEHENEHRRPSGGVPDCRSAYPPDAGIRGHTQQVLVVGGGAVGLATAGFLDQTGLEPVVVPGPNAPRSHGVTAVWEPGLALLERLGLRRPVERCGRPVTELERPRSGRVRESDSGARPALVAIGRRTLRQLITRQLPADLATVSRSITAVTSTETGVRVTFDGGVTEPFDAVVSTTRAVGSLPGWTAGVGRLDTWTFQWPDGTDTPERAVEAWTGSRAVFTLSAPDRTWVVLVSADGPPAAGAVTPGELADSFGQLFKHAATPFAALDRRAIRYERPPRATSRTLHADGVTFLGPAARATVPGDCLSLTLGIEDGWVLADVLAYGPSTRRATVDAYRDRRRRRTAELLSTAHEHPRGKGDYPRLLADLAARRRLAFGHLFRSVDHTVARPITRRL